MVNNGDLLLIPQGLPIFNLGSARMGIICEVSCPSMLPELFKSCTLAFLNKDETSNWHHLILDIQNKQYVPKLCLEFD